MADDYVIFRLSNKGILMNKDPLNPSAGTIPDIKRMGDFSRILSLMENRIRSVTGEDGFKFNRNLRYTDSANNYQYQDVVVQKDFYNSVIGALQGYEETLNIGSAGLDPLTGDAIRNTYLAEANAKNARMIEYARTIKGKKAQASFLKEAQKAGGYAYADPTLKNPERMKAFIPVTEDEYTSLAAAYANKQGKKPETEIFNRVFVQARKQGSYEGRVRKDTEKKKEEKEQEKQKEKEARKEEKEKKETRAKGLRVMSTIISTIMLVVDICRRILTATLARASELKQQSVTAHTFQIPASVLKNFRYTEQARGIKEGTIEGAVSAVQQHFGDVTNINDKALHTLSRVMGGSVVDLVTSGMGGKDPYALMQEILNSFFAQAMSGKNSLGQNVGQAQAVREITTVLQSVSPELATLFSHMADENLYGVYKGKIKNYDDYTKLSTVIEKQDMVGLKNLAALGTEVDELKSRFNQIKNYLLEDFLVSIRGLVKKINNTDIGKTQTQIVEETTQAIAIYREKVDEMSSLQNLQLGKVAGAIDTSGIDYKSFGYKNANEVVAALQERTAPKELTKALASHVRSPEGKDLSNALDLYDTYTKYKYLAEKQIAKGIQGESVKYDASEWTTASIVAGEALKDKNIDKDFNVAKSLVIKDGEETVVIMSKDKEKVANYNSLLKPTVYGDTAYKGAVTEEKDREILTEYEKSYLGRAITFRDIFFRGGKEYKLDLTQGTDMINTINARLRQKGKPEIKPNAIFDYKWKDKNIQQIASYLEDGTLTDKDFEFMKKYAIEQSTYGRLILKREEKALADKNITSYIQAEANRYDIDSLLSELTDKIAGKQVQLYQRVSADATKKQFTFSFVAKTPEGKEIGSKTIVVEDNDITTSFKQDIPFTVDFNKATSDNSMTPQ